MQVISMGVEQIAPRGLPSGENVEKRCLATGAIASVKCKPGGSSC